MLFRWYAPLLGTTVFCLGFALLTIGQGLILVPEMTLADYGRVVVETKLWMIPIWMWLAWQGGLIGESIWRRRSFRSESD